MDVERDAANKQYRQSLNEVLDAKLELAEVRDKETDRRLTAVQVPAKVFHVISAAQRLSRIRQSVDEPTEWAEPLEWQQSAYALGIQALMESEGYNPIMHRELLRGLMSGYVSTSLRIAEMQAEGLATPATQSFNIPDPSF